MTFVFRLVFIFALAAGGAGCTSAALDVASAPEGGRLPGHVYLFRGLAGDIFSRGMDTLEEKIRRRGIAASTHGISEAGAVADAIIRKRKNGYAPQPIMLIGHSTGGDAIIAIARKLKAERIPVELAFGFDPTPIAGTIPSNVELFVNLYQATNLIGGGSAAPASGFRGRIVNVDLRERREIVHITLDKTKAVHDLVLDKIVGVSRTAAARSAQASQDAASARKRTPKNGAEASAPVLPLTMKYVVPANVPIVIWDSAVTVHAQEGDTLETLAARNSVPAWAVAQINRLNGDSTIAVGQRLLVPRSLIGTSTNRSTDISSNRR